jgi:hypothetical protein
MSILDNGGIKAILLAILLFTSIDLMGGSAIAAQDVGIEKVEMEIENRTGTFHFLFRVEGNAPEDTDHVNVTFGFSNSTSREMLGFWIEPVNMMLFGNGLKLVPTGGGEDNWTSWKFEIRLNIPMSEDPGAVIGLLSGIFGINTTGIMEGIDLENITNLEDITSIEGIDELMNETGITDLENLLDPVELLKIFSETELLVIARAVNDEEEFTEDEKDIKFELIEAVFKFLESEGIVEGIETSDDDDDGTESKEKDENGDDYTLLYLMGGISIVLIIAILAVLVLILISKRKHDLDSDNFFK